jgi:hypothetical protein
MDKFYIDRQFGQAIFIDVENGIVQDCYNESENYVNRMNELYKGKSISFLKTDFESRMKPTYHNVRPLCLYNIHQKINAVDSRLNICSNLMGSLTTSEERKKELEIELNSLLTDKSKLKKELETEKQRLISEHNYNF